jgi:hypothetical protein
MPPTKAGQLTSYSSTYGELAEEPSERTSTAVWPRNYTTVEEIPTGDEVLAGTFFLNEYPIIKLFDFEASHDFVSSTCVKRAELTLVASGVPYVISTPRG